MLSSRARQLPAVPSAPRVPGLAVGALVAPVVPGRPAAWWAVGEGGERLVVQRVRPAGGTRGRTGSGTGRSTGLSGLDEATLRRRLPHPHVVPLLRVERCREGAVQVLGPAAGGCLADVLAARGHLDAGEVAVLLAGLGSALGALHEAGLVHGEVCPGGVLVDHAGLPLLLGWGGARSAVPEGLRRRELRAGGSARRRRVPAPRPADDVRALARLGLHALGPAESDDERRLLAELLRAAATAQAGAVPTAEGLARACWDAVPPVPLGAGSGALASGGGAVAQRVRRAAARTAEVAPDPAAGRRPLRARLARRPLRWSGVLLAAALLTGGGAAVGAVPAADGRLSSEDPATAVRALAELRLRAVAEHDPALLERVDVPGSEPALADARLVESLRGVHLEGATARVLSAAVQQRDGDRAWVEVVTAVSAHSRTTDGERVDVPEGAPVTSRLLLQRVDGAGWRVSATA